MIQSFSLSLHSGAHSSLPVGVERRKSPRPEIPSTMAEDVKPTRKNLMAIEDRIELSERGHDTLEKKRDGLIMEFMDILDQAQDVRSNLDDDYRQAQRTINMARAMEGDVAVRGAAAALKDHPEITTESNNIMGVVVPQIEASKVQKPLDERGYGLVGSSARIDETADASIWGTTTPIMFLD